MFNIRNRTTDIQTTACFKRMYSSCKEKQESLVSPALAEKKKEAISNINKTSNGNMTKNFETELCLVNLEGVAIRHSDCHLLMIQ